MVVHQIHPQEDAARCAAGAAGSVGEQGESGEDSPEESSEEKLHYINLIWSVRLYVLPALQISELLPESWLLCSGIVRIPNTLWLLNPQLLLNVIMM